MFHILPNAVESGGTITLNCTFELPKTEQEALYITSPGQDYTTRCSADCFSLACYDFDCCKCDFLDLDDDLCPAGTKSITYTVSNVKENMTGKWTCEHYPSEASISQYLKVYGKLFIKIFFPLFLIKNVHFWFPQFDFVQNIFTKSTF